MFRGLGVGRQACSRETRQYAAILIEVSDTHLNLSSVNESADEGVYSRGITSENIGSSH